MTPSRSTAHRPDRDPADLAEWGLHCYCPTARRTPHTSIAEGSNGRLLYEARAGASPESLRSRGVTFTAEQVAGLVDLGLLEATGGVLRTAFPILGRAEITPLRTRLRPLGGALADQLEPLVAALRDDLAGGGLAGSTSAVVFGYALDGLLWERLAECRATPDVALSESRPWWNGAFWAVHPARAGAAGTNFVDCGEATLVQVWTASTIGRLNALAAAPGLPAAVRGLLGAGLPGPPGEVVDVSGVAWQLRGSDGRPAIPIVGVNGPLDALATDLAGVVAEALVGQQTAPARAAVPTDDARVATVIVAHELIWDITDALVASGALTPARAAQAPDDVPVDRLYVRVTPVPPDTREGGTSGTGPARGTW